MWGLAALVACGLVSAAGCGVLEENDLPEGHGRLALELKSGNSAAAGEIRSVIVTIAKVRVHVAKKGWVEIFAGPDVTVDLLKLKDFALQLGFQNVPAADVHEVRFYFSEKGKQEVVLADGTKQPLKVPDQEKCGSPVKGPWKVDPCVATTLLLDFDATQSLEKKCIKDKCEWSLRSSIKIKGEQKHDVCKKPDAGAVTPDAGQPSGGCSSCKPTEKCENNVCKPKSPCDSCAPGEVCENNTCKTDPCSKCKGSEICKDRVCKPRPSTDPCACCKDNEICSNNTCKPKPNPCDLCKPGEVCQNNVCKPKDQCLPDGGTPPGGSNPDGGTTPGGGTPGNPGTGTPGGSNPGTRPDGGTTPGGGTPGGGTPDGGTTPGGGTPGGGTPGGGTPGGGTPGDPGTGTPVGNLPDGGSSDGGTGGSCPGPQCKTPGGKGDPCLTGPECLSGQCSGGICEGSRPGGACRSDTDCTGLSCQPTGVCTVDPNPPGSNTGTTPGGSTPGGNGNTPPSGGSPGATCQSSGDCLSASCNQGLCERGGENRPCRASSDCVPSLACESNRCQPIIIN
jgi:hypothetical protein